MGDLPITMKKNRRRSKRRERSRAMSMVFGIVFVLLVIHSVLLIYPFVWTFLASLKGSYEYLVSDAFALPENWIFKNYITVFSELKIRESTYLVMLWNSVWYTAGTTAGAIFMCSLVAYAIAKYKFRLQKAFYFIIVLIMIIPTFGTGAAVYKQAQDLGLMNSPLIMIKSFGGYGGFQFLVLYGFFRNVSWNYAEAAFIDGAGHAKTFFNIMLPIAKGPVLSLAVLSAITCWNDYMTPLQFLYDYPTLATGLYVYEQNMGRAVNYPLYYAGIIVCMIPILITFIAFQKTIMDSVSVGGLKG